MTDLRPDGDRTPRPADAGGSIPNQRVIAVVVTHDRAELLEPLGVGPLLAGLDGLTRKQTLADGNDYDLWDCVFTITKWVLAQDPHINDDEINSVNYKGQK